jgi:pyruvate formate lyase activating enzyme
MTKLGLLLEVDEVVDVVRKDRVFYDQSGGGVTLSGGEVTHQSQFACEILSRCKALGIHTAVETCGYARWDTLERVLKHTDLVLYDLKIMDQEKHVAFTGVRNTAILDNARRMAHAETPMVIRIPIIPGYTDARPDLEDAAEFIRSELCTIEAVHLLPYETVGVAKYERLGREYSLKEAEPPSDGCLTEVKEIFERYGLRVQVRG